MFKTLMLIGMMFVASVFAAENAQAPVAFNTPENLDEQLHQTQSRVVNATTFQTMSAQSVVAIDDQSRELLNVSLMQRFEQMEATLGVSPLLTMHTIGTKDEATEACTYYSDARNALLDLMRNMTEQSNSLAEVEAEND